jgi:hypothetical protein
MISLLKLSRRGMRTGAALMASVLVAGLISIQGAAAQSRAWGDTLYDSFVPAMGRDAGQFAVMALNEGPLYPPPDRAYGIPSRFAGPPVLASKASYTIAATVDGLRAEDMLFVSYPGLVSAFDAPVKSVAVFSFEIPCQACALKYRAADVPGTLYYNRQSETETDVSQLIALLHLHYKGWQVVRVCGKAVAQCRTFQEELYEQMVAQPALCGDCKERGRAIRDFINTAAATALGWRTQASMRRPSDWVAYAAEQGWTGDSAGAAITNAVTAAGALPVGPALR